MDEPLPSSPPPAGAAPGRQLLFYAPSGLLGGTFTCSRCGASGRHPDVIEHDDGCGYDRREPLRAG